MTTIKELEAQRDELNKKIEDLKTREPKTYYLFFHKDGRFFAFIDDLTKVHMDYYVHYRLVVVREVIPNHDAVTDNKIRKAYDSGFQQGKNIEARKISMQFDGDSSVETWTGFANFYDFKEGCATIYKSELLANEYSSQAKRIAVPVTLTWRKEK